MLTVVANTEAPQTPGTILFVDDERRVLTSMRAMFRRGYRVLTANSAAEGLEIIGSEQIDVVVSDQRMPEMTGVEMLALIKSHSPQTMRILLTGYADLDAVESAINDCEVFRYLMKPCLPQQLRDSVAQALTAARAYEVAVPEQVPSAEVVPLHQPTDVVDLDDQPVEETAVPAAALAADLEETEELAAMVDGQEPGNDGDWQASDQHTSTAAVDILVLSSDAMLIEAVDCAARSLPADPTEEGVGDLDDAAGAVSVHRVATIDDALDVLVREPVGVLVTDIALSEDDVAALTSELKQQVPALVTILASERSDANLLISLINHGQIFRFLLKPIPVGQARLWLQSARRRHAELVVSAPSRLRYQPEVLAVDTALAAQAPAAVGIDSDLDVDLETQDFDRAFDRAFGRVHLSIHSKVMGSIANIRKRLSRWSKRHG